MLISLDSLRRWSGAHPGARWLAVCALALAVLLGTTLGVHEHTQDATAELSEVVDQEAGVKGQGSAKNAKGAKPTVAKGGWTGDKLDLPQGVFARTPPLQLAHADSEQPHEPAWRRPVLPQPERLLRPPDA